MDTLVQDIRFGARMLWFDCMFIIYMLIGSVFFNICHRRVLSSCRALAQPVRYGAPSKSRRRVNSGKNRAIAGL